MDHHEDTKGTKKRKEEEEEEQEGRETSKMDAGGYLLIIRLQRRVTVRVGRLGEMDFHRGWYVYAGSAMRGLRARVERHAGRRKRIHWHIDYLLACPAAQLVECLIFPSANRVECRLNRQVLGLDGAGAGPHGFGSTDCMEGCPAHLVYFRQKPDLDHMREFAPRLKEQ